MKFYKNPYNLTSLNHWLDISVFNPKSNTHIQYIADSFERLTEILKELGLPLKLKETMWKRYFLFIAMYSIPDFQIQLQSSFRSSHNYSIMEAFTTLYGNRIIEFILDEKNYFNKYGIDITKKKHVIRIRICVINSKTYRFRKITTDYLILMLLIINNFIVNRI